MSIMVVLTLITEEKPESLARHLRKEILSLPVKDVEFATIEQAIGTRSAAIDWTRLFVTLAASGGVLSTLITAIQVWLTHRRGNKVVVEVDGDKLELSDSTDEERQKLIELWLKEHEPKVFLE
jgi:hypothetical protein